MSTDTNFRVLVVDDDPLVQRMTEAMLSSAGFDVVVADDGAEALERIDEEAPDIVLSDFNMPGLDGIEVCRRIAESPRRRPIHSILMTTSRRSELQSEGLLAGADDFLPKPFTRKTLIAHVHAAARIVERERELRIASQLDPTTRLPNRRALDELLDREWSRAKRYGRPLSCMMVDVDNFKTINDEHGHPAGDALLAKIAEVISKTCRRSEFVCRYGGDEFLVLLPETRLPGARRCAERVVEAIREATVEHNGETLSTTVSIGVAESRPQLESPADLVEGADSDLRTAKTCGRDRVGGVVPRGTTLSTWFSTARLVQEVRKGRLDSGSKSELEEIVEELAAVSAPESAVDMDDVERVLAGSIGV